VMVMMLTDDDSVDSVCHDVRSLQIVNTHL